VKDGAGRQWRRVLAALAVLVTLAGTSAPARCRAADIFIDPSRTEGCPGRGTPDAPYCGWREAGPLAGGNRYLQRRGTTWQGTVRVTAASGLSAESLSREVFLGAYGEGRERPVIRIENPLPEARDEARWRRAGPELWSYSTAGFRVPDPQVLLLDGRRAFGPARQRADLCTRRGRQQLEWMQAGDELLLCSPRGNPAVVFASISGMQVRRDEPTTPIHIENRRNVVIDGLALQGGRWGAVEIRTGASDVEIRNCEIGRDSASGVYASTDGNPISGLDIHDNLIDSGVRWGAVGYEPRQSGEGVYFNAGVTRSRISDNEIVAWTHNGIYLNAYRPGDPGVTNNVVDHNDIHCGPMSSYFDYCRPFGIDGWRAGAASGNLFFGNRLHDFSLGAQVNGDRNFVVGNYCYNALNSAARRRPSGMCFRMQAYVFSRDNLIAFNTMANTADAAIELHAGDGGITAGHRIVGNLFHGCGRDAAPERRDVCIVVGAAPAVGPQVIEGNLLYNPGGRPVRVLYRGQSAVHADRWQAAGGDRVAGNRVIAPLLVDPEARDFSLAPDSPARAQVPALEVPGLAGQPVALGAWQGGPRGRRFVAADAMSLRAAAGEPVRILFLIPSLKTGGAERQLVQLLQQLDPRRYRTTIGVFSDAGMKDGTGFHADVRAMPPHTAGESRPDGPLRPGSPDAPAAAPAGRRTHRHHALFPEPREHVRDGRLEAHECAGGGFGHPRQPRHQPRVPALPRRPGPRLQLPGLQFRSRPRQPLPAPAREFPHHRQRHGLGAVRAPAGSGHTTSRRTGRRALSAARGHGGHAF
jgi:hypothetical protein